MNDNFKTNPMTQKNDSTPLVQMKELYKYHRTDKIETAALGGINLRIEQGEFVAIMGPSGSGKSTLLNAMGLIDSPSHGSYHFERTDTTKLREKERAKLRKGSIGFVFQSFNLIDELTAQENIALPLLYLKIPQKERKQRVDQALETLQMVHRRDHYPQQLSGGQQQRIAIARAIVIHPSLILADEPTGNLDSENGEAVMAILKQLNKEGTTVVMVTHSSYDASYADRIVELFDGQVLQHEHEMANN